MCSRPRVLIVDDDRDIARGMSARLKFAGFDVMTAHSGEDGLRAAETHVPDAMILDVRMPGMDGLTVLEQLRSNERTRLIPTIMVSASIVDHGRSLELGAAHFLQKPYDPTTLLLALRSLLGAPIGDTTDAS